MVRWLNDFRKMWFNKVAKEQQEESRLEAIIVICHCYGQETKDYICWNMKLKQWRLVHKQPKQNQQDQKNAK